MSSELSTFELSLHPDLGLYEEEELSLNNHITGSGQQLVIKKKKAKETPFDIFHQEECFDKFSKERKFVMKFQMTAKEGICEGEFEVKSKEERNDEHFSKWRIKVTVDEVSLKLIQKSEDLDCMVCGCLSATNLVFAHENYDSERYIQNQSFVIDQILYMEKFDFPADELLVALIIHHEVNESTVKPKFVVNEELHLQERIDTPEDIFGPGIGPKDLETNTNVPIWMQINRLLPQSFFALDDSKSAASTEEGQKNENFPHIENSGETAGNLWLVNKSFFSSIEQQHSNFVSTVQQVTSPLATEDTLQTTTMDADQEQPPQSPAYHVIGNELFVTYKVTLPPPLQEPLNSTLQDSFQISTPYSLQDASLQNEVFEIPPEFQDMMNYGNTTAIQTYANSSEETHSYGQLVLPTITLDQPADRTVYIDDMEEDEMMYSMVSPTTIVNTSAYAQAQKFESNANKIACNDQDLEDIVSAALRQSIMSVIERGKEKEAVEMENLGYDGSDFLKITTVGRNERKDTECFAAKAKECTRNSTQDVIQPKASNFDVSTYETFLTRQQLKHRSTRAMLGPYSGKRMNVRHLADSDILVNEHHETDPTQSINEISTEVAQETLYVQQSEQFENGNGDLSINEYEANPAEFESQSQVQYVNDAITTDGQGQFEGTEMAQVENKQNKKQRKKHERKKTAYLRRGRPKKIPAPPSNLDVEEINPPPRSVKKRKSELHLPLKKISLEQELASPRIPRQRRMSVLKHFRTRWVPPNERGDNGNKIDNDDPDYNPEDHPESDEDKTHDPHYQNNCRKRKGKRPRRKKVEMEKNVIPIEANTESLPEGATEKDKLMKQIQESYKPPPLLFLEQYEKQEFCDYELLCQGKVLKVHRFVLSQASVTFKKMRHDGRQKIAVHQAKVSCCSFEVLCAMVRYCYTLAFPPEKYAMGMFQAASTYHIQRLREWAAEILVRDLNVANACEIAVLGKSFEEQRLVDGAYKIIICHPTEILMTRGFQLITRRYPEMLKEMFVNLAAVGSVILPGIQWNSAEDINTTTESQAIILSNERDTVAEMSASENTDKLAKISNV